MHHNQIVCITGVWFAAIGWSTNPHCLIETNDLAFARVDRFGSADCKEDFCCSHLPSRPVSNRLKTKEKCNENIKSVVTCKWLLSWIRARASVVYHYNYVIEKFLRTTSDWRPDHGETKPVMQILTAITARCRWVLFATQSIAVNKFKIIIYLNLVDTHNEAFNECRLYDHFLLSIFFTHFYSRNRPFVYIDFWKWANRLRLTDWLTLDYDVRAFFSSSFFSFRILHATIAALFGIFFEIIIFCLFIFGTYVLKLSDNLLLWLWFIIGKWQPQSSYQRVQSTHVLVYGSYFFASINVMPLLPLGGILFN